MKILQEASHRVIVVVVCGGGHHVEWHVDYFETGLIMPAG